MLVTLIFLSLFIIAFCTCALHEIIAKHLTFGCFSPFKYHWYWTTQFFSLIFFYFVSLQLSKYFSFWLSVYQKSHSYELDIYNDTDSLLFIEFHWTGASSWLGFFLLSLSTLAVVAENELRNLGNHISALSLSLT